MGEGWIIAIAAAVVIGARLVARRWALRQYQSGVEVPRLARWLAIVAMTAPYLGLLAFMVIRDPGTWWVALLLVIASWPLFIVSAVALFPPSRTQKTRQD